MTQDRPKVLLLRGYSANPWDLSPWQELSDEFKVSFLEPHKNLFDTSLLNLDRSRIRTARDLLPRGYLGDALGHVVGDRYFGLRPKLADVDLVHSAEIGTWFTAQAAQLKAKFGYKLAVTVWETLPFLDVYRNRVRTRGFRNSALDEIDLFLPTTERARAALLLEGAAEEKIEVCPPGVDLERFSSSERSEQDRHLVVSVGRLVWEKGHQDVLRAVAALKFGLVDSPVQPQLLIVGSGPAGERLKQYARELKIDDCVQFQENLAYDRMPAIYQEASCMVLASLPIPSWEEQFGMVLAEAIAAELSILASSSGAIPEVLGDCGTYFAPGDWLELASKLAAGPLSRKAAERCSYPLELVDRYSKTAAAERLRLIYRSLLDV